MASYNPCNSFQNKLLVEIKANEAKKPEHQEPEYNVLNYYNWFERSRKNEKNEQIWHWIENELLPTESQKQQLEFK